MVKNIVLDNGDVIHYVNENINEYKSELIGVDTMYELVGSYNITDPYLSLKKFEFMERDVIDFNELRTKHQEFWEFQCELFIFTRHIITMEV